MFLRFVVGDILRFLSVNFYIGLLLVLLVVVWCGGKVFIMRFYVLLLVIFGCF